MALVDDIEFYGRAVADGEIPRAEAVRLLVESGRLTEHGAVNLLDRWATSRNTYQLLISTYFENMAALMSGLRPPNL